MKPYYIIIAISFVIACIVSYNLWDKYSGISYKLKQIQQNTVQVKKIVETNNKLMQEVIEEVNTIPADLLQNLNIKTIK